MPDHHQQGPPVGTFLRLRCQHRRCREHLAAALFPWKSTPIRLVSLLEIVNHLSETAHGRHRPPTQSRGTSYGPVSQPTSGPVSGAGHSCVDDSPTLLGSRGAKLHLAAALCCAVSCGSSKLSRREKCEAHRATTHLRGPVEASTGKLTRCASINYEDRAVYPGGGAWESEHSRPRSRSCPMSTVVLRPSVSSPRGRIGCELP
jgi:hypothetical protein